MGGWADGRLEESKIRLTQPSLAGTGAELGNINVNSKMLKIMLNKQVAKLLIYVQCAYLKYNQVFKLFRLILAALRRCLVANFLL